MNSRAVAVSGHHPDADVDGEPTTQCILERQRKNRKGNRPETDLRLPPYDCAIHDRSPVAKRHTHTLPTVERKRFSCPVFKTAYTAFANTLVRIGCITRTKQIRRRKLVHVPRNCFLLLLHTCCVQPRLSFPKDQAAALRRRRPR